MYKIIVCVFNVVLLSTVSLHAQPLDDTLLYALKLPILRTNVEPYEAEMHPYDVRVSYTDSHTFSIHPVDKDAYWAKSLQEKRIRGWHGNIEPNGSVNISGVMSLGEAYAIVELTGTFVARYAVKGDATFRIGVDASGTPFVFKSEWVIEPKDTTEPVEVSHTVTYHGLPPQPIEHPIPSAEEISQYPITDALQIKRFARYEPLEREEFYKGFPSEDKPFFESLLTELTWEEIRYTPGILLLIDHLATVLEQYTQKIAEGYVRDGSLHFFDGIPYKELQQIPPLFLILSVLDRIPGEDRAGLTEGSPRFALMGEAYNAIPPEELADVSLSEFILTISTYLPEDFRQAYFEESPKLRNYVAISDNEELKSLYPFSAPSNALQPRTQPVQEAEESRETQAQQPEEEQGTVIILH